MLLLWVLCRGGGGSKDVHLENFSVSNGGKDLIEDASVMMAYGRRYGLIGRNGTGDHSNPVLAVHISIELVHPA